MGSQEADRMQKSNQSFVLQKANEVSFEDREPPKLNDGNDVIVEVKWTGICGSDVHYWAEGKLGPFVVEKPMVLGHESSGIVREVGGNVTTLKVGDRVAMEPGVPCRACERCKGGDYNLCPGMAFAATPPYDGTLCRYYVLPADFCYALPEQVSLEAGAVVEPTAVAVHAVRQGGVRGGDRVVVYGAGPVGLLVAAVARSFGAVHIVMADMNSERLKFAAEWVPKGCGTFVPSKDESPAQGAARLKKEHHLRDGADVVLECTGAPPCSYAALNVARPGATIVQVGMGPPDVSIPTGVLCTAEVTLKGSFRYKQGDYPIAVALIANKNFDVERLISGKVKFTDAEEAFGLTKSGKGIKTLIAGPE